MKINSIDIKNILKVDSECIQPSAPIQLFCGKNGAGKSSRIEAIKMAIFGDVERVSLKKNFGQIVRDSAKSGLCEVVTDSAQYSIEMPTGKGFHNDDVNPIVLNAEAFSIATQDQKRSFLFDLMGIKTDGKSVIAKIKDMGLCAEKIDSIAHFLAGGFDSAHKEAMAKARDEKAVWRNITGETYGDKKAADWSAEVPVFDESKLASLVDELSKVDSDLATANQKLGALDAAQRQYADAAGRIESLREKASKYARIQDKLLKDEAELKAWQDKVEAAKQSASGGRKVGLVHELAYSLYDALALAIPTADMNDIQIAKLRSAAESLEDYEQQHGSYRLTTVVAETNNKLPEYERALQLMQNAVANGKRDLVEADTAAQAIAEVEKTLGSAEDKSKEIESLKFAINAKTGLKTKLAGDINDLKRAKNNAEQAQQKTVNAMVAHEAVQAWSQIADALAPSGIPAQLLDAAIVPLNAMLEESSKMAAWSTVSIDKDMGLSYAGRTYNLLSKSEKWRVNAMLQACFSELSGLKIMLLDEFDILDNEGRKQAVKWLMALTSAGKIDSVIVAATLKEAPEKMPSCIEVRWIGE